MTHEHININNGNVLYMVKMGMDVAPDDYPNDPVKNPIPCYRIRTLFLDCNNLPIFLEAQAGCGYRKYSYSGKFKELKHVETFSRFQLYVYAHIDIGKDPANESRICDHETFNCSPYTEFFLLDAINKNFGRDFEKIEFTEYKNVFGRD